MNKVKKNPLNLPSKLCHVLQIHIFLQIHIYFFTHRSTCTRAEKHFVQNRKNKKVCIEICHTIFIFSS